MAGRGPVVTLVADRPARRRRDITQTSRYDTFGRQTFESLTGSASGTTWAYDALGRVLSEQDAEGRFRRSTYNGNDVTITDAEFRQTQQRWQAAGDPNDQRLASILDAAGSTFGYSYNALGRLVRVDQPLGQPRTWTYRLGTDLLDSEYHPEAQGTIRYLYDAAGRLERRFDTANREFIYSYDNNDRLTKVDVIEEGFDQTFAYDAADNRTLAANGFVSSTFHYDGADRVTARLDTIAGLPGVATTGYTYTELDQVDLLTYPSGTVVNYDYDNEGRLTLVSRAGSSVFQVLRHHPSGMPEHVRFGNGKEEVRTYDASHRPSGMSLPAMNLTYRYYAAGNVSEILDNRPGKTQQFTYDALDRLKTYGRGSLSASYDYDAVGNRIRDGLQTFTYDPLSLRGSHLTYGARGQVQNDGQGHYTYTPFTMVATAAVAGITTSYRYDADNLRKITIPASGPIEYVIHGEGTQVLTEGVAPPGGQLTWQRDYIYAGAQLVASIRPAPPTRVRIVPENLFLRVNEGETPSVHIQVTTDDGQPTRAPITFRWELRPGTATTADYHPPTSGTAVLPAGFVSGRLQGIQIPTVEDTVEEADERFTFHVSADSWVTLTNSVATIEIANDDTASPIHIGFPQGTYQVSEGATNVRVSVRVRTDNNQPTARAFTLSYRTSPGSAVAGEDYQHIEGAQPIDADVPSGTEIPLFLPIVNNAAHEGTEAFTFSFTVNAGVIVDAGSATIQILDDDPLASIVGFNTASQQISESGGIIPIVLVVNTQGPPTTQPITVNFATQNGTAVAGSDYQSMSGTFIIPVGTTNGQTFPGGVPILNDNTVENNEQFTIALTGGSGPALPGITSQTITIVDDDAITVAFDPGALSVSEAAGAVPVHIKVTTVSGQPTTRVVTLNYATVQSTATSDLDFTAAAGTLTIAAGTAHGTVLGAPLPIFNDAMDEPDEVYGVVLTSPNGSANVGGPLPIAIVDDDAPGSNIEVDFTLTQQGIGEAAGAVPISVRIITANGGPTSAAIPLSFWTAPGTATSNVDFGAINSGVWVAAGTASGTVVSSALGIINDAIDEPLETFTINIGMPLPGISMVPTQTIGIFDDDPGPFGLRAAPTDSGDQMFTESKSAESKANGKRRTPGSWTFEPPPVTAPQPATWTTKPPAPEGDGEAQDNGRQR